MEARGWVRCTKSSFLLLPPHLVCFYPCFVYLPPFPPQLLFPQLNSTVFYSLCLIFIVHLFLHVSLSFFSLCPCLLLPLRLVYLYPSRFVNLPSFPLNSFSTCHILHISFPTFFYSLFFIFILHLVFLSLFPLVSFFPCLLVNSSPFNLLFSSSSRLLLSPFQFCC